MSPPKPTTPSGDPIGPSRGRKTAALAIRGIGLLAGVAAVSLYGYLVWDIGGGGQPHDRPVRGAVVLLTLVPLLLLLGPYWLADRVAAWIDRRRTIE